MAGDAGDGTVMAEDIFRRGGAASTGAATASMPIHGEHTSFFRPDEKGPEEREVGPGDRRWREEEGGPVDRDGHAITERYTQIRQRDTQSELNERWSREIRDGGRRKQNDRRGQEIGDGGRRRRRRRRKRNDRRRNRAS